MSVAELRYLSFIEAFDWRTLFEAETDFLDCLDIFTLESFGEFMTCEVRVVLLLAVNFPSLTSASP